MAQQPAILRDDFWGDFLNSLFLRPVYRRPYPEEPVESAGLSGFTERALERLTGIRVRVDFTSRGSWYVAEEIDGVYAGKQTVVKRRHLPDENIYAPTRIVSVGQTRRHEWKNAENNVKFIAHAPDDVRLLMSIIGRMQEAAQRDAEHGTGAFAAKFLRICDEAVRDENAQERS